MEKRVSPVRRRALVALAAAGALTAAAPLYAGLVETLPRVKPSIVAVGTLQPTRSPPFRFLGTGFIVGNGNQVATNAHVVAELPTDPTEVFAIALPGSGRVTARPVVKEAMDPAHDLAVLRFEGPPMPALPLGEAASVQEGQEAAFTGFPIGTVIGLVPVTHRALIAAVTPFSMPLPSASQLEARAIRRLADANFRIFQLDAVSYPGNSGSPLYDPANGQVVGILNMAFVKGAKENAITAPSGISYAIPVSHLKALLKP